MVTPTRAEGVARLGLPMTDLAMIAVVLIWGMNFSLSKIALQELPPLPFAALRFSAGAVLLWLLLRRLEPPRPLPPGALWKLTWIGIVGNTFYQVGFTYGLKLTSAANAALLIAATPALVAGFGALLGIEPLRRNTIYGIALAFGGAALVLAARGLHFTAGGIVGDLMLLGCAVCWTIYTLGVRTVGSGLSPLAITTWTMVTGAPGLLLVSLPDILRVDWAALSLTTWACLGYATLLALVLAYVLWNNSVRVVGTNRTAVYGCAIPLCAALFAWPLLGEQPTWLQAAGGALIIGGVLLTRRS
ncbi:MAG: EamA family transporter [Chloroflexi bacterium OHK40]